MNDLRYRIEALLVAERLELLNVLWVSREREEVPLPDALRAEVDHRIALYEQNPTEVTPWERIKANLVK